MQGEDAVNKNAGFEMTALAPIEVEILFYDFAAQRKNVKKIAVKSGK
ncbi:hypothetical protein FNO01nite_18560 [Flavobacterium noncentrifugens]|nr:hypothetical protein [Flavobacterium noncentrifugens]GEP51184.1 hypothetical protein FNO01nite_18560 [Flavobacterium noncentrifugens]